MTRQIDHDPHEKSRSTRGETIFVTIVTTTVLILVGAALNLVADAYGLIALFSVVAIGAAVMFPLAFWLDRRR
jgi:hypothetical protein